MNAAKTQDSKTEGGSSCRDEGRKIFFLKKKIIIIIIILENAFVVSKPASVLLKEGKT